MRKKSKEGRFWASVERLGPEAEVAVGINVIDYSGEKRKHTQNAGFPHGLVLKNTPANAGDMGLIPGPEGSHMQRGNEFLGSRACKLQLLRPRVEITEAHVL